jgi:predicted metal-dependent hydrolase
MAFKSFTIRDIGTVTVYKHRRAKSIRLRIHSDNQVRVTIPVWLPYAAGTTFASSKAEWIRNKLPKPVYFTHDAVIGKQHRIAINYDNKLNAPKVTLRDELISVTLPFGQQLQESGLQTKIQMTAEKALRREAKDYLPRRLSELATSHNFTYGDVRIKKMTSRWGSCSSRSDISLSIYLMQLDDELIDYVLLHELLHTRIPAHGKKFWDELAVHVPNLSSLRKQMRSHEPRIIPR